MSTGKDSPQQMSLGLPENTIDGNLTGLNLFSSNRVESLLEAMGHRLGENPLDSVFATEEIVVPSRAMGRWVNLELAKQNGIAANINYNLPASWIWRLIKDLFDDEAPDRDPLGRATSTWMIFHALPKLIDRAEFMQLKHYLDNDKNDLKLWQLSTKIADVLDRYQLYRPELIREWSKKGSTTPSESNPHLQWQCILWQTLIAKTDTHRIEIIDKLLAELHGKQAVINLPQRYSLFVLSSLPPLFVEILHALSRHCQIDLYYHSPTQHYWADLVKPIVVAKKRLQNPDEADYYETGHELLASWGRQGQAFQDLLLNSDSSDSFKNDIELYQDPGKNSLLHQIQSSILELDERELSISEDDDSLQIHICHSAYRECQVLHDQILHCITKDPSIKPEDILVMVPDISSYAPYIEAVFSKDESGNRPTINWNLSDTTIEDEHPLIRSFFSLLKLPDSRLTTSEVLSFLDIPEVQKRFELNRENIEDIVYMVKQANVRWGADGKHKAELGLPEILENTWKQAEQRLFSGYAMGDVDYWKTQQETIAPIDLNSRDKALGLGKLWSFLDRLTHWRLRLREERTAEAWQTTLNKLLDQFFTNLGDLDHYGTAEYRRESDGKIQQIRDVLDELMKNAGDAMISADLLQQWLNDSLGSKLINGRYFSGGVTFCGMRPMRSLPFNVICLLGMNNTPFPRLDHPVEFDALNNHWRQGDPIKGDEDRYLFLETLLCTRRQMIITYSGRDVKDNSERQPSVLVQELIDFIDEHDTNDKDNALKILDRITTNHPLQPFSPQNYNENMPASFDRYWYDICKANSEEKKPLDKSGWPDQIINLGKDNNKKDSIDNISLDRLKNFFKHPAKFFFNEQLKIYLTEQETSEDEESFSLNSLEKWQIKQDMLDACIDGKAINQDELSAKGMLPHGAISALEFSNTENEIASTQELLQEYKGAVPESRRIEITIADTNITGQIGDCMKKKGLLCKTASLLHGKYLMPAFLDHLALCASGQLEENEKSTLITRENLIVFKRCSAKEAEGLLETYIKVYKEGQKRPLPVLPNASWAWVTKEGDIEAKRKAAHGKWKNQFSEYGDDWDDVYIKLIFRGIDSNNPFDLPEFQSLTETIYGTAYDFRQLNESAEKAKKTTASKSRGQK